MKLLNYTTSYFSAILLVIISVWAVIFYYGMIDKVYMEINESLVNQKQLIIKRAHSDSEVLRLERFGESNYTIKETDAATAIHMRDQYIDSTLFMASEGENEPIRILKTAFLLGHKYYLLSVTTSTLEEDDVVKELLVTLIWLYAGLAVCILLLNNFLLRRVWNPFYELLHRLRAFKIDMPTPVTDIRTNIHEFKLLNETVQKMLDSNRDIYNNQKQFIENASHEMQTPLAISLNKLETLAGRDGFSPQDVNLLSGAISNLERLTRLNKSLLLLSKISNRQFDDVMDVNMTELVQKAVKDFEDMSEFHNITVTVNAAGGCLLKMNAGLASMLVNNLIKNALVHNIDGGVLNIVISQRMLQIENTGKSAPLNEEKMFLRFYKDSSSNTSTGLGLAIVKAITDLYHFGISYSYNTRHVITVTFPTR